MSLRLYLAQRISAAVMLPLILVHLGTILYAVDAGLTAAEILARTRGSLFWGLFYGLFVAAASVHAAIGLRTVLGEWTLLKGWALDLAALLFALVLAGLGARAVYAVVLA
ncbi:MAG: succinate dehydrogenase [Kiloniellales bacterium]|nr:succinate dehydrogenase [Kiloniellales bacterium]